jgi:DNA-directed RNA polymerase subunit RPC12/RpoP
MENKKGLRKVHGTMLGIGIVMSATNIITIALWITMDMWIPFAIFLPFVILSGVLLTRMYHKSTAYICAECNATFRPPMKEFIFSNHTPKTRKLTCSDCGKKSWCVEVYSQAKLGQV